MNTLTVRQINEVCDQLGWRVDWNAGYTAEGDKIIPGEIIIYTGHRITEVNNLAAELTPCATNHPGAYR